MYNNIMHIRFKHDENKNTIIDQDVKKNPRFHKIKPSSPSFSRDVYITNQTVENQFIFSVLFIHICTGLNFILIYLFHLIKLL